MNNLITWVAGLSSQNGKLDKGRHEEAKNWLAMQCLERGISALPVNDAYGLYGGEQELAIDFRGLAANRAEFEAVGQLVRDFGKRYNQIDVFLSEYVEPWHKNARPLFILPPYDSTPWQDRAKKIVDTLGIDGFTVIPSGNDDGFTVIPSGNNDGIAFIAFQPIPEIALRYNANYPNDNARELENYASSTLYGLAIRCGECVKVVSVSTQCWGGGEYDIEFPAGASQAATLESEIERRILLLRKGGL